MLQDRIEHLTLLVLQTKESIHAEQAINASSRIEVRQSLSEIQLIQFLHFLTVATLPDPAMSLKALIFMREKRLSKPSFSPRKEFPFWLTPKMQNWNSSKVSSLIMINGTHKLRFQIKDFCANSISVLQDSGIPVIWAMKALDPEGSRDVEVGEMASKCSGGKLYSIEILKYLISQAIRVNRSIHNDVALAPCLKAYLGATTEQDWFNILGSILQGIPLLYIFIDIEVLESSDTVPSSPFSLPSSFLRVFQELKDRGINTAIRVALVSYGSPIFRNYLSDEHKEMVTFVGGGTRSRAQLASRPMVKRDREKRSRFALGQVITGHGTKLQRTGM
ncbi:hypothetical protein VTL71DRAFT_14974 [Oculimacula yallundae]|uniref:Uncharacterized protein n=1 Tax=Oculimacula yallundae TaxID=86028 RepID=A0ABR4CG09_9HELO